MVDELVAKNNFYTSELYLEPEVHQNLEASFNNATMRNLFENILFLHIITTPEEKDPVRLEMANTIWEDHTFCTKMLKLRHIYMAKSECLIHSDLHTSNIMVDADHMKTIDMEYAFMGPCSADSGYLIGNFLYQYLRWFYCPATADSTPEEMRAYALDCIRDFLNTYFDVFKACWAKDVRKIYQGFDDYRDYLLDRYFHETVGFIACQIMSRIGRDTATPDIDTIPEKNDQYEACRILLLIAQYLVLHREEITDTDDLIKTVVELTKTSRKALY